MGGEVVCNDDRAHGQQPGLGRCACHGAHGYSLLGGIRASRPERLGGSQTASRRPSRSPARANSAGSRASRAVWRDTGCQAIASQISGIHGQISADSGNLSAQMQVWQAWYNDLQAARQKTQNGTVAGALGDTAAGVEKIILDEQNLLEEASSNFGQLDREHLGLRGLREYPRNGMRLSR